MYEVSIFSYRRKVLLGLFAIREQVSDSFRSKLPMYLQ